MRLDVARTLLLFVYQGLALSFSVATMGALALQLARPLRIVGGLHRSATGIDLF